MTRVLWVPGKFALTNELLAEVRAAGFYAGKCMAKGVHPSPGSNRFNVHQQAVRLAVRAAVGLKPGVMACRCDLAFWVFGHRKHDPDAWYLLAKAAADGLADAGVLASDRFNVGVTRGRVLQTGDEEQLKMWDLKMLGAACPPVGFVAGLAVEIGDV